MKFLAGTNKPKEGDKLIMEIKTKKTIIILINLGCFNIDGTEII
jgi:hypothetical protein